MVGFRRPRCTIHKKKKQTSQAFWKRFFSCRSISRACDHPFYYQSKLFEKSHNPFSFYQYLYHYYLSIIILLHTKKQIFLLYLSIYYWFYSFYYITILMHLKEMTTTLQKQISIKFSNKNKTPYAKILST